MLVAQDITVQPVITQEAKTAIVIPGPETVQVLMTEPKGQSTGALVTIPNPSKFTLVRARKDLFTVVQPTQLDSNQWFFSLPPGKYLVTVTQFDPEKGIDEQNIPVTIGQPDPTPDPGPDPDPDPVPGEGDMAKVASLAPPDVVTTERLIALYKTETSSEVVFEKRKEIMRTRPNQSFNWNPFIVTLNQELAKGDYVQNIRTLATLLESRVTTTCVNGVCYKTMK
jgi:hypothetical protein